MPGPCSFTAAGEGPPRPDLPPHGHEHIRRAAHAAHTDSRSAPRCTGARNREVYHNYEDKILAHLNHSTKPHAGRWRRAALAPFLAAFAAERGECGRLEAGVHTGHHCAAHCTWGGLSSPCMLMLTHCFILCPAAGLRNWDWMLYGDGEPHAGRRCMPGGEGASEHGSWRAAMLPCLRCAWGSTSQAVRSEPRMPSEGAMIVALLAQRHCRRRCCCGGGGGLSRMHPRKPALPDASWQCRADFACISHFPFPLPSSLITHRYTHYTTTVTYVLWFRVGRRHGRSCPQSSRPSKRARQGTKIRRTLWHLGGRAHARHIYTDARRSLLNACKHTYMDEYTAFFMPS